ncbi:bifunctional diaminohydroxyphosphoribosylaminopyrimidine deaminase/5-amino-6-(5-phosphoribosylamino)uracil reductase RibD [Candidatus Woesearchaeota archaeon]|nr:bifunctional diaminohydroxyphosphoribosylaminopyrimidine deaminase/5-amino-6-(5-phosphoribosylamino)uracil reductase RibD [Candidatus Woesearchaeota archaeon]
MSLAQDKNYMQQALELALRGNTLPNPFVGCVIVKNNKVIATGYHRKPGEDHAEINALSKISLKKAKGSTIYLTLEPCCHYGKTPPCIDNILAAKPKRVVIGMKDPFLLVNGKSIAKIKKAGIAVSVGVLEHEIKKVNREYIKYITKKEPYVYLKSAITKDGKITWADGKNKQISGEDARIFVHKLRNRVNAILVGINTILHDNPRLTTRLPEAEKHKRIKQRGMDPLRIVLDSTLRIPLNARVLNNNQVIIVTTRKGYETRKARLLEKKIKRFIVFKDHINLRVLMKILAKEEQVASILLEGGMILNTSAINSKIVDKLVLIIGDFKVGNGMTLFKKQVKKFKLTDIKSNLAGNDLIVVGKVKYI